MATNAVGEERRYWGMIPVVEASLIGMLAKQSEEQGMEGLFAPQVYGPPFIPLAAAATMTNSIKLATGIAIAAARSPTETAMAAIDMDRISNGRFILGPMSFNECQKKGFDSCVPRFLDISRRRQLLRAIRSQKQHILTKVYPTSVFLTNC